MDAKSGYWIVGLDKESSLWTTFNTEWGKFRWLWLPFGLPVSSNVFPGRLDAVIKTVPDVTGRAHDVLIKGDSEINHEIAVLILLETVHNNNLKFKPDRIQFKTRECVPLDSFLTQMAWVWIQRKLIQSGEWMHCSAKENLRACKVWWSTWSATQANLNNWQNNWNSFWGMTHYGARRKKHQKAIESMKDEPTQTPVLAYFDQKADTWYKQMGPWRP